MNKNRKIFVFTHSNGIGIAANWFVYRPNSYYIEGPGTTENLKEFVTVDGKKIRSLVLLFNNGGHSFGHYFSAIKANFSDFQEVMSKKN